MERDSADIAAIDSMTVKAKEDVAGLMKELYAAAAQNASDIGQRFACHVWRDMVAAVEKKDANVEEARKKTRKHESFITLCVFW